MSHQVTVQPSGHRFVVEGDATVLSAAIDAGLGLPYGCRNGACGACKGKVLQGEVSHNDHQASALTDADKAKPFRNIHFSSSNFHTWNLAFSVPLEAATCA